MNGKSPVNVIALDMVPKSKNVWWQSAISGTKVWLYMYYKIIA